MSFRRGERPVSALSSSSKVRSPDDFIAELAKDSNATTSVTTVSVPEFQADLHLNRQAVRYIFEARFNESANLLEASRWEIVYSLP